MRGLNGVMAARVNGVVMMVVSDGVKEAAKRQLLHASDAVVIHWNMAHQACWALV